MPSFPSIKRITAPISLFFNDVLSFIKAPEKSRSHKGLHDQLLQMVQVWVTDDWLARADGYIYAVDIGQLMMYAVNKNDYSLYIQLRDFATKHFIINNSDDPYTQGFTLWRYRHDTLPDASGTTEALRLAEGLWFGSIRFGEVADRERALLLLQGYTRHAYIDQGIWLIRNYFNLQTRSFINNSFLVDYDPDFIKDVAESVGDSELSEITRLSYALIRHAVSPCHLLYEIIQPEVQTILPDIDLTVFSPNDIIQLSNSCTIAERAVKEAPEVGQKILAFALQHRYHLRSYYYGTSGREASNWNPGPATYASLVRLAVKLGNKRAIKLFSKPLMSQVESFVESPYEPRLYVASELLLALQSLR